MKKKLLSKLYKSILTSDFFLLQNSFKKQNVYIDKVVGLKSNLNSLDFYELIQSIKQFIRILFFVKSSKKFTFYIKVDSSFDYDLLKEFLRMYPVSFHIKVEQQHVIKQTQKKGISFLLLLEKAQNRKDVNLFDTLLYNRIYLTHKINSKIEVNSNGIYKMYNDLLDFKKIVFLIVLINKIFLVKKN
jgi:hypothetical protein